MQLTDNDLKTARIQAPILVAHANSMVAAQLALSLEKNPTQLTAANCLLWLAHVCDGAQSRDYRGFDSSDADMGHHVANKLLRGLAITTADWRFIAHCVVHYQGQLARQFSEDKVDTLVRTATRLLQRGEEPDSTRYASVRYAEEHNEIVVTLPAVRQNQVKSLRWQLSSLAGVCGVSRHEEGVLRNQIDKWRDASWIGGKDLRLPLHHQGVPEFLQAVSDFGYMVDPRAYAWLNDPHMSYFKLKAEPIDGTDLKRWTGYIRYFRRDEVMMESWRHVRNSVGYNGLGRVTDKNLYTTYVGDRILPALSGFLEHFDVGDRAILDRAVKSRVWDTYQPHGLIDAEQREAYLDSRSALEKEPPSRYVS